MVQEKTVWNGGYSREEAMEDAKWLLLLVTGAVLQLGLMMGMVNLQTGLYVIGIGVVFWILALVPLLWVRLIGLLIFTSCLSLDLYVRRNPFSIFFILVGIYHLYVLIRYRSRE